LWCLAKRPERFAVCPGRIASPSDVPHRNDVVESVEAMNDAIEFGAGGGLESRLSRCEFVGRSAAVFASLAGLPKASTVRRPPEGLAAIEHVVVLMMENRSFDHLLGWLPGANGRQAGLTYMDGNGVAHGTYPLAPDFQGCGHPDPEHDVAGALVEYDNGAADGFLRSGSDIYAVGYYIQADLPFLGHAAPGWTVCDNYFAAFLGPTFPNRLYLHAARTDRADDSVHLATLPTIWDRLARDGLHGRYYFHNAPFLALWGTKYLPITYRYPQFLHDCRTGKLPQVAFVDPLFTLPGSNVGADDHPHADIRSGEYALNEVYRAVVESPAWPSTLLIITFDEWGGFFDHVPPPPAQEGNGPPSLRGFRVPTLLISPFARRGHVDHAIYDHTSILKLIETRWQLEPLSSRDARAANLARALDFTQRNLSAPRYLVPAVPGANCP
jgi:phospholipase C